MSSRSSHSPSLIRLTQAVLLGLAVAIASGCKQTSPAPAEPAPAEPAAVAPAEAAPPAAAPEPPKTAPSTEPRRPIDGAQVPSVPVVGQLAAPSSPIALPPSMLPPAGPPVPVAPNAPVAVPTAPPGAPAARAQPEPMPTFVAPEKLLPATRPTFMIVGSSNLQGEVEPCG